MKLINNIRSYLLEDELEINVFKDKINVVNYQSIGHFDNNKVVIHHSEGDIVINGKNLVVSRLLSSEILVVGTIQSLELR